MKITKKLLGIVLSIAMVASTLVMPITAEAAAGDFIYKVTFDEEADATGVFGAGDHYQVVAGTEPTVKLQAEDKVAKLSADYDGTLANASGGDYLFGGTWGDRTSATHATLQFDVLVTNAYNAFEVYPAGNGNDSGLKRYGVELQYDTVAGENRTLKAKRNGTTIDTGAVFLRRIWHEIAIEWDLNNHVGYVYLDGNKVDTWEGISGAGTPNDIKFKMTNTAYGEYYINNLYYYEGGYNKNIADPIYPIYENDFSTDGNAAGFAGKDATDLVYKSTDNFRPVPFGYNSSTTVTTSDVVTYELSAYIPATGKLDFHVYNTTSTNNSNRGSVKINKGVISADFQSSTASNSVSADAYEPNTWNKIAMEMDKANNTVKFFLNGSLIHTVTGLLTDDDLFNADFGTQGASDGVAIDNLRMYPGKYTDQPITVTTTSTATVSGNTVTVYEGATLENVTSVAAGMDSAVVYTDTTLTTPATTVEDGDVLLVKDGELYKTYTVKVVSLYGDMLYENDFSTGGNAAGFAGKDATDLVYKSTDNFRPVPFGYNSSTTVTTSDVVTYEFSAYIPATGKLDFHVYNTTSTNNSNRGSVKINKGVISADFQSSTASNSVSADAYEPNTWNKIAMEMDKANNTVKFFLNGSLIHTVTGLLTDDDLFNADFGTQGASDGVAIDNLRMYTAAYVKDEAIEGISSAADGVLKVSEGSTAAQVEAMVTESGATAELYTSDLKTASTTPADGDVLIINKGELYKAYEIDVASKYDGALLSTNFNAGSIDYEGYFAGNATSSWLQTGSTAAGLDTSKSSVSYTQPGGKESKALTIAQLVPGTVNTRLQTGWGSANTNYSSGVYTIEAQIYKDQAVENGSIGIKMRSASGSNKTFSVSSPAVAHEWYKLAITVDTVNGTIQGYVNGEEVATNNGTSLTVDGTLYNIVSDQVNVTAAEHTEKLVTTSFDNFRIYEGEYKGDTMPEIASTFTADPGATVADVIIATKADFVVDANGNVVSSSSTEVETGMKAVAVSGECYAYCDVTATAPETTDIDFSLLKVDEKSYLRDDVEYVFVAVTTPTISDISLYKTFACTDGVKTEGKALSEMIDTTVTGSVQLGVLVMNVPAVNKDNFKAKLLLEDIANLKAE